MQIRILGLRFGAETISMVSTVLATLGCSASSSSTGVSHSSSDSNSSSSGGASSTSGTGSQPGFVISDASTGGANSGDAQVEACTNGDGCVCPTLSVAVIGNPGQFGSGNNTDTAFQDWLNSSSAGTAKVDNYKTKPTLTADFLAGYNVIIFTGLANDSKLGPWWVFDAATEVPALEAWVRKGGGVITINGMSGDNHEVDPDNVLLKFTGISYNTDGVSPPCTLLTTNGSEGCSYCVGGSEPITDWNRTEPLVANLSLGVTMVGLNVGRTINAPSDAYVAATTPATYGSNPKFNLLVGKIVGQGRVLVYADEWITYTSQWDGSGLSSAADPQCAEILPQKKYQTAQFWYNMIRWTQPSATCFKIVDKQQPVSVW